MAFENSNAAEETMSIFKDDRKGQFKDLAIDHRITGRNWPTALRIREFRRPQGYKKTRAIIDRCVRLGLRDTQVQAPTRTSIGLWGIDDQHLSSTIQKQQLFWIGNHFEADVRQNFADVLSTAIEQGYTKEMLADTLKDQFNDLANRSSHYWQGLAEHTALRIR